MESTRTIVLDGYYGAPNIGDELILASIVQSIRQREGSTHTNYHITVSSHDPEYTMTHHDVDGVVPRFIPSSSINQQWFRAVSAADEFWIGGGGLFGPRKMLKYAAGASVARSVNTRVATIGVGVRPFDGGPEHSRRLARELARHADCITVRDGDSADALRDIGVHQPVHAVADPVFGYDPHGDRDVKIPEKIENRVDEKTILVSVREPEVRQLDRVALVQALDRVINATDASLLFIPFQTVRPPSDVRVASELVELMDRSDRADVVEGKIDFRVMVQLLSNAPLVVGMRLHSIITAATVGTSVVGISYHPKCDSILRQLGQDPIEWCDSIDSDRLAASIIEAWEEGTPGVGDAARELRQRTQSLIEITEIERTACSRARTPVLIGETVRAGVEKILE